MTGPSLAELTARALRGAWRAQPPTPALTPAELERVTPHLLAAGAAGVGWWAIRHRPELAATAAGAQLADAHRLHRLHEALHERRLATVLDLCEREGVEPLLVKGWTLAGLYPERGLRPYGDVDLVVAADDHHRLQSVLDARPRDGDWVDVDLEHAFLAADGTPRAELLERSREAEAAGRRVRVLCREDQLRLTSIHFLRAGGWRALHLCDVALLLENGVADWDLVLPPGRRRQWVAVAAAVAADLLGADLRDTPLAGARAPGWVRAHVLAGFATTPADRWPPDRLRRAGPAGLARQLRERWGDPLELTIHHRRRIPARRPAGLQLYDLAYRTAALALPLRSRRAPRSDYVELAR